MEIEKQRSQKNRRRERAQRMLAQRESLATAKQQQQQQQQQSQQSRQRPPNDEEDSHSGEDEDPAGGGGGLGAKTGHPRDGHSRPPRPPRPPRPRKKSSLAAANQKEPPFEEDIIDGFAILAFRTYEDLEVTYKSCFSALPFFSLPLSSLLILFLSYRFYLRGLGIKSTQYRFGYPTTSSQVCIGDTFVRYICFESIDMTFFFQSQGTRTKIYRMRKNRLVRIRISERKCKENLRDCQRDIDGRSIYIICSITAYKVHTSRKGSRGKRSIICKPIFFSIRI